MGCVTIFSSRGAHTEQIHDFLAIVAEEVPNADLLGSKKYVLTSMSSRSRSILKLTGICQSPDVSITLGCGTNGSSSYHVIYVSYYANAANRICPSLLPSMDVHLTDQVE